MNDDDWSITELFPKFGDVQLNEYRTKSSPTEREELDSMFEVVDKIDCKPTNFVLSTSIYCRPHNPGPKRIEPLTVENLKIPHPSVRGGKAWWNIYFRPLLADLDRIRPPWIVRVHLAEDLDFLLPHLKHPRVETWIMKHSSELTMPGMLWRYMPLEEGVNMIARGADSLWPDPGYWHLLRDFNESPCRFFRRFLPRDQDGSGSIVYRAIPGPLVVKEGSRIPVVDYAKTWIWFQRSGLWPTVARLPWLRDPAPKFGMQHWAKYGQDEQFLSHWIYHLACGEGLYTVTDAGHSSRIASYDMGYVESVDRNASFLEIMR